MSVTQNNSSPPPPTIVPFKNSLQTHVVTNDTLSTLLEQLSRVPLLSTLRLDIELTLHACKIIETIISLGDTKVDKKAIILSAFKTIYPDMTDTETILLTNQIDFLYSNGMILVIEDVLTRFQRFKAVIKSIFSSK